MPAFPASALPGPRGAGMTTMFGGVRNPNRHAGAGRHPVHSESRFEVRLGARIALQIATPMKVPCVYILASKRNGTLYTCVTSDLANQVSLHKQGLIEGFTKRYKVHMLVYYETHHLMPDAIRREKQIKEWKRLWKIRLIESMNPEWFDLFDERTGEVFDGPADVSRVTGRTSDC